jgi:hypothetical protein
MIGSCSLPRGWSGGDGSPQVASREHIEVHHDREKDVGGALATAAA